MKPKHLRRPLVAGSRRSHGPAAGVRPVRAAARAPPAGAAAAGRARPGGPLGRQPEAPGRGGGLHALETPLRARLQR